MKGDQSIFTACKIRSDAKGLRKRLVQELRGLGIKEEKDVQAIEKIPRHLFIQTTFEDDAYDNKPFPIGHWSNQFPIHIRLRIKQNYWN